MMKKYLYVLCLWIPFVGLVAQNPIWNIVPEALSSIDSVYLYEGNDKGKYIGDRALILTDGSIWKAGRKERIQVDKWKEGDLVHVKWRGGRHNHPFYLYNHRKREKVKAMLLSYPTDPLYVVSATDAYPTRFVLIVTDHYDHEGNWTHSTYSEVPTDYKKRVWLSNGTGWEIDNCLSTFFVGTPVYVGCNEDKGQLFLISGKKKKSGRSWAQKIQ